VVSVTDPYGRILGFIDRNNDLHQDKFHIESLAASELCIRSLHRNNGHSDLVLSSV
jgi:hypothetical protein